MANQPHDDPVYLHSRREALLILLLWGLSFFWTVPYCYLRGYQTLSNPEDLRLVWGMPAWVTWGVAVPWITCGILSILICLFVIRDDDLGHAGDEADSE
ncbi:MAG: DUF997 family protein [Planctomycetaceae bacterium]|nr:DUF997 family protein [Planctomycetaceae bacterium]